MSARAETVTRLANESVIHSAPIEEFDFEGVAYTMNAIGWRWHNLGTPPDATVLRKTVTHLISSKSRSGVLMGHPTRLTVLLVVESASRNRMASVLYSFARPTTLSGLVEER
jgi:hypothetical protein